MATDRIGAPARPGRVGLLISRAKLERVLKGKRDRVYCRYSAYAEEAGWQLVFFAVDGLSSDGSLKGYLHRCGIGACAWEPVSLILPRAVYDRCFGAEGRAEALRFRAMAAELQSTVVNHLPKITKLQAFQALEPDTELAPHLPLTQPLTPDSLREAMRTRSDLYLKPNALYKGKGVCRLSRGGDGWLLQSRESDGDILWYLPDEDAVLQAVDGMLSPEAGYVLQEGLPLARFLGNRFDFRAMVQRDGAGRWHLSGIVARVAPEGGVITSPRSGGQVASAKAALSHAFPDRWQAVLAELERVSVEIAERLDQRLGPCTELGLDIGVTEAGHVKLIEANGKPLRVSLDRLRDPQICERINRCPIHYLIRLSLPPGAPPIAVGRAGTSSDPIFGVLLGAETIARQQGAWSDRYRAMATNIRVAGMKPLFFSIDDLDLSSSRVQGWTESDGQWEYRALPLPDLIYNRATYPDREKGRLVRTMLKELNIRHSVQLINPVNSLSKSQVGEALRFYPESTVLAPETAVIQRRDQLDEMLDRHPDLFLKADHGSHGANVLRVRSGPEGWEVRGRYQRAPVLEWFESRTHLLDFLVMLPNGQTWVAQRGIPLPTADGRVFDFRVIAQKGAAGEWVVPLVLVRLAAPDRVAANMSQGGEPYLPWEFRARFPNVAAGLIGMEFAAAEAARLAVLALESRYGRFGEIGIDVGIDTDGRPWVLEANTKPLHPQLPGRQIDLTTLPALYGAYLVRSALAGRRTGLLES